MVEKHDIDVPADWKVERYETTGHGKLIARFRCPQTEWELNIVPYRSYELPGFTDSHRITLTKDDSVEVVAQGLEVEHAEEAEEVAFEVMEDSSV